MGFFSKRKAFNALEEGEAWFRENKIDPASVVFSTYDDSAIVKYPDASVIVGMGNIAGFSAGFVLEVAEGRGALSGSILPAVTASHHRNMAHIARKHGRCLIDVLIENANDALRD
tara:strand:+ start:7786 stop:8130 length:345 start_codon:yes stop_codon:yes gene_type:complete